MESINSSNKSINMGEESITNVMVENEKDLFFTPRLWNINYNLRGKDKGVAVVKANNAAQAEQILKAEGMYNGSPTDYLVTKIEEIIAPPCCGLVSEQNLDNNG